MEVNDHPNVTEVTPSYFKPVETRRLTDKLWIILVPVNLLLWIGIGIFDFLTFSNAENSFLIYDPYQWTIIIYATAALLFIILLTFLSSKFKTKFMVVLVIIFIAIVILSIILFIAALLYTFVVHITYFIKIEFKPLLLLFTLLAFIAFTVMYFIYHATVFYYTRKVDLSLLAEMINEPSRAILGSLSALWFSLLIVLLSIIIIVLTEKLIIFQLLHVLKVTHVLCKYLFWLRIIVFGLAGTYMFNLIWNFGFIVMSNYFANYYSTPGNQKEVHILQNIKTMTRHHFGTIAYLSIPIVPTIRAFTVAFNNSYQHGKQSGYMTVHFFSKICLVMNISDYASILTSIYGYEASESIKKIIALRYSNSVLFLYANVVSYKIVEISMVLAVIAGLAAEMLSDIWDFDENFLPWEYMSSEVRFVTFYVFETIMSTYLMSAFFLRPALCTFSIYKMTSLWKSATSENLLIN